eukprot:TRINITY_DN2567_c0_g1_i5.p1 TRINITY_DN2567_c0_g1~~TRINITY_DN2567_c0_g1_i5.p1  ORF type:complete len:402 (+),score=75.25 TRINITY_DN2567_c0_g1_i5:38-1243(+)
MPGGFEQHTTGFGSRILRKMGYSEGHGLGKDRQGTVDPVSASLRSWSQHQGLSAGNASAASRTKKRPSPQGGRQLDCEEFEQLRKRRPVTERADAAPDFEQLRASAEMRVSGLKAAVFDMSALLQDAELLNCTAWDQCLVQMLGIPEEVVHKYPAYGLLPGGLSDMDSLLHLLAAHHVGFHWSRLDEMLDAKDELYAKHISAAQLRKGVRPLLSSLQDQGWRFAVVQKGSRRRLKCELRQAGLMNNFLVQVSLASLSETQQQRPYTDMYTEARLRMQVPEYSTVVLESSQMVSGALHAHGLVHVHVPADVSVPQDDLSIGRLEQTLSEGPKDRGPGLVLDLCKGAAVLVETGCQGGLWMDGVVEAVNHDSASVTLNGGSGQTVQASHDSLYLLSRSFIDKV